MVCVKRFAGGGDFTLLHLGDKNTDQSNHKIRLKKTPYFCIVEIDYGFLNGSM